MKEERPLLTLLLIITAGVLLRIIYMLEIRQSPFFLAPFGDGEYFHSWAASIAAGQVVGREIFFKAPLYAYVLGFFYWLFGELHIIPRLLNLVFDAATMVLLHAIGKKLWNRTVGLIAAAIFACGGIFIYFSGEILGTCLAIMLGLAAVNVLIYEGKRFSRWLFAGVVLSLFVLVRPNGLLLLPAAIAFIASRKGTKAGRSKRTVLFLAGISFLLIITGVRNYAVGGDVVLVNYSGGVNFYIGNNEESDGVSAVLPGYGNDWDEYSIAEKAVGHEMKPSEVSRYWMVKGFRFMTTRPLQASVLAIKKCYLLLNGKEISNNQNIYRFANTSYLLRWLLFLRGTRFLFLAFPSSVVIALGISGMLLSLSSERRRYLILYLFIIFFGMSVVLFFISARYRMPLVVFLVPFAAFSLHAVWLRFKRRMRRALWFLQFLPLLLICNIDPYGVSMENEALECYNLGNAYFRKNELKKARMYYERAIVENACFPRVHLNLGAIHFKEQRYAEAERAFLKELEINPNEARTYHNLSLLYEQEGRLQDALSFARKAVKKTPRYAEAQRNLGRLYIKTEQYDSAAVHLERAYGLHLRDVKMLSLLGLSYLKTSDFGRARNFYLEALKLDGDDAFLEYHCGLACIGMGAFGQAEEHLLRAIHLKHDFAEAHFNLGLVYLRVGEEAMARVHFSEALRIQPDLSEAKKMIEKMD